MSFFDLNSPTQHTTKRGQDLMTWLWMKTYFNSQKVEPTFISQSLGYHGLGAAWGPVEQYSFRWLDPHAGECLRVPQRPLNGLLQFQLHLLHPTNIWPANLELWNMLTINGPHLFPFTLQCCGKQENPCQNIRNKEASSFTVPSVSLILPFYITWFGLEWWKAVK